MDKLFGQSAVINLLKFSPCRIFSLGMQHGGVRDTVWVLMGDGWEVCGFRSGWGMVLNRGWIRCLWGFWGFKDSGEPGFSLNGPSYSCMTVLELQLPSLLYQVVTFLSPFYDGLLSSGSPTVESTGLVLTPWFRGQEAWCKGPLVTGSAAGWRRLGRVWVCRQDVGWGRQKGCCRRQGVPSTPWVNAVGVGADDDKKECQVLQRTFWADYKYTKEAIKNLCFLFNKKIIILVIYVRC